MKYTEQLKNSTLKSDRALLDLVEKCGVADLVNAQNMGKHYNRGDIFEMCLTRKPVKRDGLHSKSAGDTIIEGVAYEVKYITKKTSASVALKGTSAPFHLIGFNDGEKITIRIIPTKSLKVSKGGKLKYQENATLGKVQKNKA